MATKYTPDYIDQCILLLIGAGESSTSYLAGVFGISLPSISQRKRHLEEFGLIEPINSKEKQSSRSFRLTELGEQEIDINHALFSFRMLTIRGGKMTKLTHNSTI